MLLRTLRTLFSTTPPPPLLHSQKFPCSSAHPPSRNLLIIPGILNTTALYRPLISPSIRSHYTTYILDLPDHGLSPRTPKLTVPSIASSIAHWILSQHFTSPLTIVAHSLGGRAIVSLTSQFPQLQSIVQRIILLDVATHSYVGFPFHKKTSDYLRVLSRIDLKVTREEVERQLRKVSGNESQFEIMRGAVDFERGEWRFNLEAIREGYEELIGFGVERGEWEGEVVAVKALRSAFMNEFSKEEMRRVYKRVEIREVDCYHNIWGERADVVEDILRAGK